MSVPVKIECPCGQHYTFDVERVEGRIITPMTCPNCGADGTAMANEIIAQSTSVQSQQVPASATRLRVSVPAARSERPAARLPGQVDPSQALMEARAKVSWGDSEKDVLLYLMAQGFTLEDAQEQVEEMFTERRAAVRAKGIKYIVSGIGCICVPLVAFVYYNSTGYLMRSRVLRVFLVTVGIGLFGVWLLIRGAVMLAAPKSEVGDVAEP